MPFPYVEVAGTPYEMGREHGRQASAQIAGLVDYLVTGSGRSREEVLRAALRFQPLFQAHCPALLEEVRGLAEGAGLRFEEALLLQIRGETAPLLQEEACTTFAVSGRHTRDGGILIGQTSDMGREMERFFIVLRLAPAGGPRVLMWTLAGQLGYHGLNEHGVAHFANSVSGGPVPGSHPGGLPHYPVKRRLYECRTRAEVLAAWGALPVCSSGNYMMASGDPSIFDVEATPEGFALLEDAGAGYLAHANHFLSREYRTAETDAAALPDSFPRQERMAALLRERLGEWTADAMKQALADHQGLPSSICRHEETGARRMGTVAGLVAEPGAGRLHVSRGNPCDGDWTCYEARG
jgi:isopenicillin-N N-acyltransferase-like protein